MTTLTTKLTLAASVVLFAVASLSSCGNSSNKNESSSGQTAANEEQKELEKKVEEIKKHSTGIGPIESVEIGPFDAAMAAKGKGVYELKCQSCHRIEGDRLVGPTFKGVTGRHTPEWVMNMIMNTDAMLNEDPDAQSLLELCLVRMPNQNVPQADARNVVEYFREIDGHKKAGLNNSREQFLNTN